MTGGSIVVLVFGTVLYTKDIMAAVMLASVEVSGLNVAFQLEDLGLFLSGEKPLRAPTGNQLHDACKAWTEMITGYIATLGLQNPRTYGPTYERLPNVTLPVVTNAGVSGSTALAAQNTGLMNAGVASRAGSLALLPQMNVQAANYALAISNVGNSATYPVLGGGDQTKYTYNMVENPRPLASMRDNPASNFSGGKYNFMTLTKNTVFYRAGKVGTPLGQWFTFTPAESVTQVRIDNMAVKLQ